MTVAALDSLLHGPRPQEVLTPRVITDFVRDVFYGPILLDPCAPDDPRGETVRAIRAYTRADDGLRLPWNDRTFCNPPYGKLRVWLEKSVYEAAAVGRARIITLAPVRSRSGWWRTARDLAKANGSYVELDRVTFVGYSGTFPESLGLFCYNVPEMTVAAFLKKHRIGDLA